MRLVKTAFFLFILIGFSGCNESTNDDIVAFRPIEGTYTVVSYFNTETGIILPNEENSWGYETVISFNQTSEGNTISGRNTTNSVYGKYELLNSNTLRINALASTKVGQPTWGDLFLEALQSREIRFMKIKRKLEIYGSNNLRITLIKQ